MRSLVTFVTVASVLRNDTMFVIIFNRYSEQSRQFSLQICFVQINVTPLHLPSATRVLMPHQGEILQEAIKNSGISITRIVEEMGITRPTIYRKFKEDTIAYDFVKKVGDIIGHDFSQDFTALQQGALPFVTNTPRTIVTPAVTTRVTQSQSPDTDLSKQLLTLQTKYISLLEAYNELLLKVYGPK